MLMRTTPAPENNDLTALQKRVAREIVALVRRENRAAGDHLREVELSQRIGTSRSPVQVALRFLAQERVVQQDANRGFSWSSLQASGIL